MTPASINAKIKRHEGLWAFAVLAVTIIAACATTGILISSADKSSAGGLFLMSLECLVANAAVIHLFSWTDKLVRKYAVKSYRIEDCGDVVKLHGSVRPDWAGQAYRDLLAVKPGLHILDREESVAKYGVTLAAEKCS